MVSTKSKYDQVKWKVYREKGGKLAFDKWFKKAVNSIEQSKVKPGKVMVVCSDNSEVKSYMDKWLQPEGINIEVVYNNGDTSYCGQINHGVELMDSEYFSILE